jgi:dihydroflavonol-4-reductase
MCRPAELSRLDAFGKGSGNPLNAQGVEVVSKSSIASDRVQAGWLGRKVLVTGASGFLGYHVVKALVQAGASVQALVRRPKDVPNLATAGVTCIEGNLENASVLAGACRGCDYVFHLAAAVDFGGDWQLDRQVNVEGTRRVIEAVRDVGVDRLVYTSSMVTIGASYSRVVLDEQATWNLESFQVPYVTTKREAEYLALSAADRNLAVVVVNPAATVGPDDFASSQYGALCDRFWRRHIPFYFAGGNCFVDVRDVALGHLLAARHGVTGQRYILGGANLSYAGFFQLLARVAKKRIFRMRLPLLLGPVLASVDERARQGRSRRPYLTTPQARLLGLYFYFSSARAERELGYRARAVTDTLDDTYKFWLGLRGKA